MSWPMSDSRVTVCPGALPGDEDVPKIHDQAHGPQEENACLATYMQHLWRASKRPVMFRTLWWLKMMTQRWPTSNFWWPFVSK